MNPLPLPTLLRCLLTLVVLFLTDRAHAVGFPNVTQTPGALLVGPCAPTQGRLTILFWHNGVLYSSPETVESTDQLINGVNYDPDYSGRAWDVTAMLANPANPKLIAFPADLTQPSPVLGYITGMNNSFDAHGAMYWNDLNGSHAIGARSFRATATVGVNTQVTNSTFMPPGFGPFTRGWMLAPWFASDYWVTYDPASGLTDLRKNSVLEAQWNHLATPGGVKDMPMLCGNLLIYAATGSEAGAVIYDLSLYMDADSGNDPAAPPIVGQLSEGGFGGYWPELYGWGGRMYLVNGKNGIRVTDITDPTAPFIAQLQTDSTMSHAVYPTFQDQYAFLGGKKIDMTNFATVLSVGGTNVTHTVPGVGDGKGINVSQINMPLGNLLVTGGLGTDQGLAIWAHQAAPDTRGPEVGFHIPRAGQTSYPVGAPITILMPETLEMTSVSASTFIVRPVGGSAVSGRFSRTLGNCILTFFPDANLAANTTYEVVLPAGGIKDAAGNGIAAQYAFTFSTGSTVAGNLPPNIMALTASANPVAPATSVTLTATATDTTAIEYRFDFADGTGFTAWSGSNSAARTYAAEGHYAASVQARDAEGAVSTRQAVITVIVTPPAVRPTQSSQLARDLAGRIWVVNPDNDSVSRLDPVARTREATYPLDTDAGKEVPRGIAVAANCKVWVACHDDDAIRILNPTTGAVETTLPLRYGAAPFAVCMSPDGLAAYVTLYGTGELLRYDTAAPLTAPRVLAVGPTPRAIAVSGNGARILVTRFLSQFNHGEVWDCAWNGTTLTKTRTIALAIIGNIDGPADGTGAPNYLTSVAIEPGGARAYVTTKKDFITGGELFGHGDHDIDADETVRAELRGINLATNVEDLALRLDFDNSDSVAAIAFSPLGDYLFVPQQGNNLVTLLDRMKIPATVNLGAMVGRTGVGLAPQAVLVNAATQSLAVHNFMDRTVTFLDLTGLLRSGSANLATLATVPTLAPGTEALGAQVLFGKQLFYNASALDAQLRPGMGAEGYLSCATCHLDGAHDGRTWDFTSRGEGLRNTTDLRGRRGTAHGNVHWSANFDEIQDFVHDMKTRFGGTGFLPTGVSPNAPLGAPNAGIAEDLAAGDPLDALAEYLISLRSDTVPRSVLRNSNGTKTTDATNGAVIFTQQGCATCHTPAKGYTDSSLGALLTLSDVGTLRFTSGRRLNGLLPGLDTPTLAGLADTAPYFHDGSARTLGEVFSTAGGDMYPMENAALTGSATRTGDYYFINHANSPMGAFIVLRVTNDSATLGGVDGGAGGTGTVTLRFVNTTSARTASLLVNDTAYAITFPVTAGNHYWDTVRVENVALTAGFTNTVVVRLNSSGTVYLDEMTVSRPDDLARGQPHRRVLALTATQQSQLIAYLQQLDGSDLSDLSDPAPRTGPTANPDSFSVNESVSSDLAVLANDLGTGLTASSTSDASLGTARATGAVVRYTPAPWAWSGADSFSYAARDANGRVHWSTVNVTIAQTLGSAPWPAADFPVLGPIGTGTTARTRWRTDGLLELAVTGGAGFAGGASDDVYFARRAVAGNFRVTVQVRGVFGEGAAGLLLRDVTNQGARFVSLGATTGSDYVVDARLDQGAAMQAQTSIAAGHAFPNKWLRLERVGDVVTVSTSANGATFTTAATHTLTGLGHWTSVGLFGYAGWSGGSCDALFNGYTLETLAPTVPDTAAGLLARYDFENTGALGTDTTVPDNASKLWLGTLPLSGSPGASSFLGALDDVRIYRDRALSAADVLEVLEALDVNLAPLVSIAPPGTAVVSLARPLNGTVADDGLPTASVISAWSVVSGPGSVVFGNANATDTTATFSTAGSYVLRLTASDGEAAGGAEVVVNVADYYIAWIAGFGLNGTAAQGNADPDGDGLGNALECALDLNPLSRDLLGLPQMETDVNGTWLTWTFHHSTATHGLTFAIQQSPNLTTPFADVVFDSVNATWQVLDPNPDGDGSAQTIKARVKCPASPTRMFLRMQAR